MTTQHRLRVYEAISTNEVLRCLEDGDTVVLIVRDYRETPDLQAIADTLTERRRSAAIASGEDPFASGPAEALKTQRMVILSGIIGILLVFSYRAVRAGAARGYGADLLLIPEGTPDDVSGEAETMTDVNGIVRAAPALDHAALVQLRTRPEVQIVSSEGENGSSNAEVYREDGCWVATFARHEAASAYRALVRSGSGTELVIR